MTMKTNLMPCLALSLAACAKPAPTDPGWTPTSQATRARGDLIPRQLTMVTLPQITERETISGSDPASPKDLFARSMRPTTRA
jgi:hypothetical protein